MPSDEGNLLREYVATRSQPAFASVVERYVDLVYSAARRQVRGDTHLAEDVTQAVFIVLAEKAAKVPPDRPLSGWLLKTTSYCAANARRSQTHRQFYERRAAQMARDHEISESDESPWEDLSPLLDEGLNKLRQQDRDALLLRFFEKKSLRQIGEALGISEEAAGKRVSRAVDRLRDFFRRRGVAVSAAALPVLLMTNASQAAPAGMISSVIATTGGAAAAAGGAATFAKGAIAVMAAEKAKAFGLATALIIVGVGAAAGVVALVMSPVSNQNRQVNVSDGPAPAPTTMPAISNAWPVRLPDGTLVEVIGLCDPNSSSVQWWAPDGSPSPAVGGYQPALVSIPQKRGARTIHLVLRFNDVVASRPRTVLLRPNVAGGTTASSNSGAGLTHHVALVPEDQQTAEVVLFLGGQSSPRVELRNISLVPGQKTAVRVAEVHDPQPLPQTVKR